MELSVLIAESDAKLRDLFRQYLGDRGFAVETAADGLDCVNKLRAGKPAVLVLDRDLLWGGADGVLEWLREESDAADIAVIVTETRGVATRLADPWDQPAVRYLPKPFTLAALLASVRAALADRLQDSLCACSGIEYPSELFIG